MWTVPPGTCGSSVWNARSGTVASKAMLVSVGRTCNRPLVHRR